MDIMKRTLIGLYLVSLELACTSAAFAVDQVAPQPYPWPWWREMQWPTFGWIFPLVCFAMMVVMLLFMIRRGGKGCMWRGRPSDRPGFRDPKGPSWGDPAASALATLNERYVKGEIDKQECEEIKADLHPI